LLPLDDAPAHNLVNWQFDEPWAERLPLFEGRHLVLHQSCRVNKVWDILEHVRSCASSGDAGAVGFRTFLRFGLIS
jgi:hypothetical protein